MIIVRRFSLKEDKVKLNSKRIVMILSRLKRISKYIYFSVTSERPYLRFNNKTKKRDKKNKIYDCFYFFNELDLLEIRLNILNDYVDYFVLLESSTTFTGLPKKMNYSENIQRFEKFKHKIIYYQVNWSPKSFQELETLLEDEKTNELIKDIVRRTLNTRNIPKEYPNSQWITEYYQKESLMIVLSELNDKDIVYISDVDEIWNPTKMIVNPGKKIFIFKQIPYIYFLNNRSNEFWHQWTGTIACEFSTLKKHGINESRTHNRITRYVINNGGWHFSFQGGKKIILEKMKAYSHLEIGSDEKQAQLQELLHHRIHLKNSSIQFKVDNEGLPEFVLSNKSKYSNMFL
jgi:beta-1,4-mannosyl-glycoprotein beta-1,4-N-acetylglucosaminyltransferase